MLFFRKVVKDDPPDSAPPIGSMMLSVAQCCFSAPGVGPLQAAGAFLGRRGVHGGLHRPHRGSLCRLVQDLREVGLGFFQLLDTLLKGHGMAHFTRSCCIKRISWWARPGMMAPNGS